MISNIRKYLYTSILFYYLVAGLAQNKPDSLLVLERISQTLNLVKKLDTNAIAVGRSSFNLALKLGKMDLVIQASYAYGNALSAFNGSDDALQKTLNELLNYHKSNNKDSVAVTLTKIANLFKASGDNLSALIFNKRALEFFKKANNKEKIGDAYNNLGILYKNMGDFDKAFEMYGEALQIRKSLETDTKVANTLLNIGVICKEQKLFDKAMNYYQQALGTYQKTNDSCGIANTLNNQGIILHLKGETDSAMGVYQKVLMFRKSMGDNKLLASTLNNIGNIYLEKGDYYNARKNLVACVNLYMSVGDKYHAIAPYINMGELYFKKHNFDQALNNYTSALNLSIETGAKNRRLFIYGDLFKLYKQEKHFKEAVQFADAFILLNDSIFSNEKLKITQDLDLKFQLEQRDFEDSVIYANKLNEKQMIVIKSKSHQFRQQVYIYGLLVIIILVLLLAISTYRRLRNANLSGLKLAKKNKELEDTRISKEEKDILLKEIHHRVKNNLQIINSLMRLQAERIKDPILLSILQESQNRIKSMALVHDELFRSEDMTKISVSRYLENLVKGISLSYDLHSTVLIETNFNVSQMGIDILIPIGLIVNEILSNSYKHAFDGIANPKIYLYLSENENVIELLIKDNGNGFYDDIPISERNSLGLELIETLCDQIDGQMKRTCNNGVSYLIIITKVS